MKSCKIPVFETLTVAKGDEISPIASAPISIAMKDYVAEQIEEQRIDVEGIESAFKKVAKKTFRIELKIIEEEH